MESVIEKSKNYVDIHKKYVKMAFELLLPKLSEKFNLTREQIADSKQQIELHDNSKYSDDERHIIWCYKYLNTPIESLNKKEQNLFLSYRDINILPE